MTRGGHTVGVWTGRGCHGLSKGTFMAHVSSKESGHDD